MSVCCFFLFYTHVTKIDGSVDIPVAIVRDLSLKTDFFLREIEFFALVTEELTGRKYNSTSYITLHDKEIKVELVKTSETFKPGLKYTCFVSGACSTTSSTAHPVYLA